MSQQMIMINDASSRHGYFMSQRRNKKNFSRKDCEEHAGKEKRIQARRRNGGQSVLPIASDCRFRCFACACKTKSRKRVEQAKYRRDYVAKTVYIIRHRTARRSGTENGPDRIYMRVCCTHVTQEIGRTCVNMCLRRRICAYTYVCMYVFVSVISS